MTSAVQSVLPEVAAGETKGDREVRRLTDEEVVLCLFRLTLSPTNTFSKAVTKTLNMFASAAATKWERGDITANFVTGAKAKQAAASPLSPGHEARTTKPNPTLGISYFEAQLSEGWRVSRPV
ncbi:hypothetical protein E2C01_019304 [Portunus trituberculatus]|uniref:Uncharacterized protein n=1 Tax=Portunus trituberculatus TaxID=210409 RepID=A0A5B7DWV9_PORTR|nr:hypothetical protein [Portunus trituberculatus]